MFSRMLNIRLVFLTACRNWADLASLTLIRRSGKIIKIYTIVESPDEQTLAMLEDCTLDERICTIRKKMQCSGQRMLPCLIMNKLKGIIRL